MPNINDFKSKLRGGGARANQFRVTMPFPGFASVGGETETMSFLCTSTSLPGMTIGEVAIPFRGRELYVAGDRTFATWTTTMLNDTDFLVVCDETNNTGEVIDRNEFKADIFVKPARSINFITLTFVATRTGVSFDEVVGA